MNSQARTPALRQNENGRLPGRRVCVLLCDRLRSRQLRTKLRLLALAVGFAGFVFWFFGGPNLGWTKTTVEIWQIDPVTEIKFPVIEKRFVPGIDFLAACILGAAVLSGLSFAARRR